MKKVTVIWEVRPRLDQVFYVTEMGVLPNGIVAMKGDNDTMIYAADYKEVLVEEVEGVGA